MNTNSTDITFAIEFFDAEDQSIGSSTITAPDHWDACLIGHDMLKEGVFAGAVDFQLTETA